MYISLIFRQNWNWILTGVAAVLKKKTPPKFFLVEKCELYVINFIKIRDIVIACTLLFSFVKLIIPSIFTAKLTYFFSALSS